MKIFSNKNLSSFNLITNYHKNLLNKNIKNFAVGLEAANKHKDYPTAQRDFLAVVDACASECRFERNQWLIPHWEGIEIKKGSELSQSSVTDRKAVDVHGPEALKQHQESAVCSGASMSSSS